MTAIVVCCWLCVRDDAVLAVRPAGQSVWYLPGGLVEPGEAWQDAVVREVHEEVAVRLDVTSVVERARVTGPAHRRPDVVATLVLFDGQGTGEPVAQPPEIDAVAWLVADEWAGFAPLAERAVRAALA